MISVLNSSELTAITGYKQGKKQCIWLANHGWVFEIGADGVPRVDRRYADQRMIGQLPELNQDIDASALDALYGP